MFLCWGEHSEPTHLPPPHLWSLLFRGSVEPQSSWEPSLRSKHRSMSVDDPKGVSRCKWQQKGSRIHWGSPKSSSLLRSMLIKANSGPRERNMGRERWLGLAVKRNTALPVDSCLVPTIHNGQLTATCNLSSTGGWGGLMLSSGLYGYLRSLIHTHK